jgi:iron complex outermembrane recepter protein
LNAVRGAQLFQSESAVSSGSLIADGPIASLPTGEVKLAVGTEFRREQVMRSGRTHVSFDRTIESTFAELAVPLVGNPLDARAVPRLELSLAARYERYSDFGSTSNPKIGLRWAPSNAIKLRTSWGTSFRAPKLRDVYDPSSNSVSLDLMSDPHSLAGSSIVLTLLGNNRELKEETASTWTAGFDLAPPMIEGLTLSATYYSIDYDNRILVPGMPAPMDILRNEDQWSSVINRSPTQEQINAACDSPYFVGIAGDCRSAAVAAIADLRVTNIAATKVSGVDLKIDYSRRTSLGQIGFGLDGGYVLEFKEAVSSTAPMDDILNSVGNPLTFRARGTAEWHQREWGEQGFGVGMTLEHFNGYSSALNGASYRRVGSLSTVDLLLSYRTAAGMGAFDSMEIGLNAANVFNESPPFVDTETGYDTANADPYGRVVSFSVQKSW